MEESYNAGVLPRRLSQPYHIILICFFFFFLLLLLFQSLHASDTNWFVFKLICIGSVSKLIRVYMMCICDHDGEKWFVLKTFWLFFLILVARVWHWLKTQEPCRDASTSLITSFLYASCMALFENAGVLPRRLSLSIGSGWGSKNHRSLIKNF